jgi:HPt (histidine-containing phosphotransfer) domain-containing protein
MPEFNGLDDAFRAFLSDACGCDSRLVAEILGLMLQTTPSRIDRLAAAVEAKDHHEVAREAHSLKGAFLTVGAESLAVACESLVLLGDQEDAEGLKAAVAPIIELWGRLEQDAKRFVDELKLLEP